MTTLIILYYVVSVFAFSQMLHIKEFNGSSRGFLTFFIVFCAIRCIVGAVWLVMFGIHTHWYYPVIMWSSSFIVGPVLTMIVSNVISPAILSLLGLLALPTLTYFMFSML